MYPFGIDSIPLQLWILQTKATLATQVNTMISAECVVRIIQCSVVYVYKAWILTLSPIMGYSMLPHTFHCYIGGLANYLVGISASVFNLLTNFLRQVSAQCGNYGNSLLHSFWQKFRESNVFTKEVTKQLISRNIFCVRENFLPFHTVVWYRILEKGSVLDLAQCGNLEIVYYSDFA